MRQNRSSKVRTNFLLKSKIKEWMSTTAKGTVFTKVYWDLSIEVFPMNVLKAKKDIVKRESNLGEFGNTSRLSSVNFSLEIFMNRIPELTIMNFRKVRNRIISSTITW